MSGIDRIKSNSRWIMIPKHPVEIAFAVMILLAAAGFTYHFITMPGEWRSNVMPKLAAMEQYQRDEIKKEIAVLRNSIMPSAFKGIEKPKKIKQIKSDEPT